MGPLFVEQPVPQPVVQYNPGPADPKPYQAKLGTDLPQDISGHVTVIPNTPAKPYIYHAAG